jgi:predicted GTPase
MEANSQSLPTNPGSPTLFKLSLWKKSENKRKQRRSFVIGSSPFDGTTKPEKRILIVGETRSGKTTILNGLANCLYGVQWIDPFRFRVVTKEDESRYPDVKKQTRSHPLGYNIVMIHTPGFGDTDSMERDQETVRNLKSLLESQGVLGADCLRSLPQWQTHEITATVAIKITSSSLSLASLPKT